MGKKGDLRDFEHGMVVGARRARLSIAQIISDWFLEHDNEFTLLKWPPKSPDLSPIEHLWDVVERKICIMDVQLTNLQQLRSCYHVNMNQNL